MIKYLSLGRFVLALCMFLGTIGTANAADWTIWGARNLETPHEALRVNIGWPSVDIAYHFPFDTDLELAPKASFSYGRPAVFGDESSCCGFGLVAGSEARWLFFSQNGFSMAVRGEAGLILDLSPVGDAQDGVGTGLRIGPGLAMDYAASADVNVVGGIDIPVDILFQDPTLAVIPFLLRTGLEFHPTQDLLVFTMLGMGPAVLAGGDNSEAGFGLEGRVGTAYRF